MKLSQIYLSGIQLSINIGVQLFERKTVSRLMEHIADIEGEKLALLQQIEQETIAQKPVVIPREVASAIEFLKSYALSDYAILALSDQTALLGRDYSKEVIDHLVVIKEFANYQSGGESDSGPDVLLEALVNGYTVETLEGKIESKVLELCEQFNINDVDDSVLIADLAGFSKAVNEAVAQIIQEDQEAVH